MRNSLDQDGLQTCLREGGLDCSMIKVQDPAHFERQHFMSWVLNWLIEDEAS